ncbi:MAG: amidase [Roseivirga sp.]|nr:amidase [Roseivirga sp.]
MNRPEIIFDSVSSLARKIQEKELTCQEVTRAFLSQIDRFNDTINAISDLRNHDDIIEEAEEKDRLLGQGKILGPLHGIPMTVKDGFCVEGLISSNGNPKLTKNIPDYDATLIKRLKASGAIIIGKSNIAFLALDWQTNNAWFGRTNNPYDPERMVGGSSGGSAAALAAGFTPLELGTDAGGSIRVPAHCCGVYGIRTTEFALPNRGNMVVPKLPKLGRYMVANGGMARNIKDLILLTQVLWEGDIEHTENPPVPFRQVPLQDGEKIKIAFSMNLEDQELSKAYSQVYLSFINRIRTAFSAVTETKPSYDGNELTLLWGRLAGFDFAAALKGIPFKSFIAKTILKLKYNHSLWAKSMGLGAGSNAHDYAKSLDEKDRLADQFNAFFEEYDIWITPVAMSEAFKHHKTGKPLTIDGKKVSYADCFIPYNFPTTVPGHPIVVIPIGRTEAGIPVGVQVHGKRWQDFRLLQIAERLEPFTEGFQIPPLMSKVAND